MFIENSNVRSFEPIISPFELKKALPLQADIAEQIIDFRDEIKLILDFVDMRLLVIVGPCSIHNVAMAKQYFTLLATLAEELADKLFIVARVYFEKPRSILGWKGLINDPKLDGSCDINLGLNLARELSIFVASLGLPNGMEFLETMTPQFLADLVSWGSIGARTTESQLHKQLASGLTPPIGFKNSTSGDVGVAVDSIVAASYPQSFFGIDEHGQWCKVNSLGNNYGHLVLRGAKQRPNYDLVSLARADEKLQAAGVRRAKIIDCSHDNSAKNPNVQASIAKEVVRDRVESGVVGVMIESNIEGGKHDFSVGIDPCLLRPGQSITDPCLAWTDTEVLLKELYDLV